VIYLIDLVTFVTLAALVQTVIGAVAVRRFSFTSHGPAAVRPSVTILKPLHGDEPLLEQALGSLCAQDYPDYQIVFGVQNPGDPALAVLDRLIQAYPNRHIDVIVDPTPHGSNGKVANLINMFPFARHDILVIADSDVHCKPDYIDRLVETLDQPGTGLATVLYGGIAASNRLAGRLGAAWINQNFLPGALMARWLGRQDSLGATMALRRETLSAIGGLPMLVNHLADDHVLGKLVQRQGLRVRLADTMVTTTVPEHKLADLYRHEIRWARTILALVPVAFALSSIQFPLFWALLTVLLSGGAGWAFGLFVGAWAIKALCVSAIDHRIGSEAGLRVTPTSPWLLPLRDLFSMTTMLTSYTGDDVEWRGEVILTGRGQASDSGHPAAATRRASAT
jgi:ceramide glucosyltransferase